MRAAKNYPVENYHTLVVSGLLFGGLILLLKGYNDSFLIFNGYRNAVADAVFPYLTHLGDGGILCGLAALLFARRYPWAIVLLVLAVSLAGGFAQLLKRFVFEDWMRPLAVFGPQNIHGTADGGLRAHSFPSGHATAAMAGVSVLALTICHRTRYVLLLGGLGIAVAHSRVYVGAHFFGDVVAGALLGYGVAVGMSYLLQDRLKTWFSASERRTRTWGWVLTGLGAIAFGLQVYNRFIA